MIKSLCEKLKILKLEGTPHHQQSNPVEAPIREIQRVFTKVVPVTYQENYVPLIQMIVNSRVHRAHGCKPFELMFVRKFDSTNCLQHPESANDAKTWEENSKSLLNLLFPLVNKTTNKYRKKYQDYFNNTKNIVADVEPGSLVMIKNNHKVKGKKMEPEFLGPFKTT